MKSAKQKTEAQKFAGRRRTSTAADSQSGPQGSEGSRHPYLCVGERKSSWHAPDRFHGPSHLYVEQRMWLSIVWMERSWFLGYRMGFRADR